MSGALEIIKAPASGRPAPSSSPAPAPTAIGPMGLGRPSRHTRRGAPWRSGPVPLEA